MAPPPTTSMRERPCASTRPHDPHPYLLTDDAYCPGLSDPHPRAVDMALLLDSARTIDVAPVTAGIPKAVRDYARGVEDALRFAAGGRRTTELQGIVDRADTMRRVSL